MCAWKYKILTSKVTVAKLQLLKPKQITNLLGMNLEHLISMLEKTPYNIELSEIDKKYISSRTIEEALQRNFIKTFESLIELSPKDIQLLLSCILTKFEANCVKAMLRTKQSNLSIEEAIEYIVPAGNLDISKCKQILEISKDISDVIENLSEMQYGPTLEKAFVDYNEEKIFYILEVALDRYVYSMIWKAIRKLHGLDKKIAKSIIGIEIDAINIKTILRCKRMGIRDDKIKQYLVPVSDVFGKNQLENIIKEAEISQFINSLVEISKNAMARDYYYIFDELQKQKLIELSTIEKIFDKGLVKTSLRMIKRYTPYFNLGLILAFLNLKRFEVRNLRAIARGIEVGISPEKVKKTLVLPE